jgi:hypothetical protein
VGEEEELIPVQEAEAKQKVDLVVLEAVHGMLAQLAVPVILLQLLLVKEIVVDQPQAEEAHPPSPAVEVVAPELLELVAVVPPATAALGHNRQ